MFLGYLISSLIQGDMRPSLCEPLLAENVQHHRGELELEETDGQGVEGSGEANTKMRGLEGAEETQMEINPKAAEDAVTCQVKVSSPLSPPPKTNVNFKPLQSPSSPSQRTPESVESSESPTGRNAVAEASKETKAGE